LIFSPERRGRKGCEGEKRKKVGRSLEGKKTREENKKRVYQ
jgi:hypothetical protein